MTELLDGVLSESLLEVLASDLGVEASVLRKHPFFRVLKGRVLLTYPLRVTTCDYVNPLAPYTASYLLSGGQVLPPPAGTIVMVAALSVAAKLQLFHGNNLVRDVPAGAEKGWIGATYCDGTDVKYKNSDAGEQTLYLEGVSTI